MEKEYIKREAVCKDCVHYCVCKDTVADENWDENAPKEVREMFSPSGCENYKPTANVVEVQYGEWFDYHGDIKCSVCGMVYADEIRFMNKNHKGELLQHCPNCGTKMDGENK